MKDKKVTIIEEVKANHMKDKMQNKIILIQINWVQKIKLKLIKMKQEKFMKELIDQLI